MVYDSTNLFDGLWSKDSDYSNSFIQDTTASAYWFADCILDNNISAALKVGHTGINIDDLSEFEEPSFEDSLEEDSYHFRFTSGIRFSGSDLVFLEDRLNGKDPFSADLEALTPTVSADSSFDDLRLTYLLNAIKEVKSEVPVSTREALTFRELIVDQIFERYRSEVTAIIRQHYHKGIVRSVDPVNFTKEVFEGDKLVVISTTYQPYFNFSRSFVESLWFKHFEDTVISKSLEYDLQIFHAKNLLGLPVSLEPGLTASASLKELRGSNPKPVASLAQEVMTLLEMHAKTLQEEEAEKQSKRLGTFTHLWSSSKQATGRLQIEAAEMAFTSLKALNA